MYTFFLGHSVFKTVVSGFQRDMESFRYILFVLFCLRLTYRLFYECVSILEYMQSKLTGQGI